MARASRQMLQNWSWCKSPWRSHKRNRCLCRVFHDRSKPSLLQGFDGAYDEAAWPQRDCLTQDDGTKFLKNGRAGRRDARHDMASAANPMRVSSGKVAISAKCELSAFYKYGLLAIARQALCLKAGWAAT